MSEALQKLIQQAEEQKKEVELQLRFAMNLKLFKERFPNIFKSLENHKPTKVILKLDPARQVNLVDIEKRKWFYDNNPLTICKKQVDIFSKETKLRKFHVVKSKEQNKRHLHIKNLNTLLDNYEDDEAKRIKYTPTLITNLIVSGVGLGYHLAELVSRFNIKNILIYENSKDAFYASLFTLDWQLILDYFSEANRSIIFCIGVSPERALEQIESATHNVGLHSQIFTFAFKHSSRECESAFLDLYVKEIRSFIGGLGYFDDERIGLAHAHHNILSDNSVFTTTTRQQRKPRLLIVGNGPSLDLHKNYLEANKDKAIIFSCGTALASLIRMGIKPDFHVEMERPTFIEDVINAGTSKEERAGITLLCLHTVSPRTLECFDEACYAIKPNDAGGPLVHSYFKPNKIPELAFSNPTVTNCALAFAASMGFTDVHLVGVDLGVKEDDRHHSEKSIYYDYEKMASSKEVIYQLNYKNVDKSREGNFGGMVKTPTVLDMARVSLERLLEVLIRTFPEFSCVNSNDGVKIKHTKTIRVEDIADCKDYNKQKEISDIKKEHFLKLNNKRYETSNQYLAHFMLLKDVLKLDEEIDSEDALYNGATKILQHLKVSTDPLAHYMMRGTANCYLGAIIENCLYCASKTDFKRRVKIGIKTYNSVIDKIFAVMQNDPFEIDDTINMGMQRMRAEREQKVKY